MIKFLNLNKEIKLFQELSPFFVVTYSRASRATCTIQSRLFNCVLCLSVLFINHYTKIYIYIYTYIVIEITINIAKSMQ